MNHPPGIPIRIDGKGKYYTKVVSTNRLEVVMHLRTGELIRGLVHLRPDHRLSDELNDDSPFLSVTDAVVTRDDAVVYATSYLAVHRGAIAWVIPRQAIDQTDAAPEAAGDH
ncbi:MAG: DUF6812 domain-containing protein [Ardenticatenaceae bacterium]